MGLFVKKLDPAKAVSSTLQTWLDKWWLHSPDTRARRSLVHDLQKIIDGRNGHVDDPLRTFLTENHDKLDESNHKRGRSNFSSILSAFVCQWRSFVTDEGLDCPTVHFPLRDDDIAGMTDNEKERILSQEAIVDKSMLERIADSASEKQFHDIVETCGTEEPTDPETLKEVPVQMDAEHSTLKIENGATIDIFVTADSIHIKIGTNLG